jgi:hypothetical protein
MDRNPLFRKIIVPWYDSDAACYIVLISMLLVLLFSITGISVARAHPIFHAHTWVPVLLTAFSSLVLISVITRLVKRYLARYSK